MANLKYSRQRASIKEYLANTTSHPTADTVYLHVREEFPRISLGTVYRNLNLLADMGEADVYKRQVHYSPWTESCYLGLRYSSQPVYSGLWNACRITWLRP